MLARLAGERATGALLRDTGVLYLADGAVVHAESPRAPGIEVLLTGGGRLSAEAWLDALDRAGPKTAVSRQLIDHHLLSEGELEISHLGALFDAAFFVLAPGGGPSRFRHGAVHWFGAVRPVPVTEVERETRRRRRFLEEVWPCPRLDTAPLLRRRTGRLPPATRRQRAVLDLADGTRTAAEIAVLLGRPAFHTLVDVRRLALAGRLEIPVTGADRAAGLPAPQTSWLSDITGGADVTMLRRLRDALEAHL
ncbi:transcriptional regulator [Streptomyces sp. CA-111067]|uniref:transcriptional regulator n=1 Tax=Streptomyces sp. CA-111067 TaxID=3240046 RepID=UPI003D96FACB